MRTIQLLYYSLLIVALAACSNDEDKGTTDHRIPVRFASGNIAQSRTTAGGTQWEAGNRIGIYMVKNGQALSGTTIVDNAGNVPYQAGNLSDGNTKASFTAVDPTETIYYPPNGKVDFIAYYPHQTALTDYMFPVNASDQLNPEYVLYSNNATALDKTSSEASMSFTHMHSKLNFTLISGEGSPGLTGAKISITGVATQGQFNLVDGSVTTTNTGQSVTAITTANGLSSQAIMLPQALPATVLTVEVGSNKFEWTFPATTLLQAGKIHEYTITVSKTKLSVSPGNISSWTGGDTPPTEAVVGGWEIGDYYPDADDENTAIGVVFWLDPLDSRHGKIVGLNQSTAQWSTESYLLSRSSYGLENMQYVRDRAPDFNGYPAFLFVHQQNDPNVVYTSTSKDIWYLPGFDELRHLYSAMNGVVNEFNLKLTTAGGYPISGTYWTSTGTGNRYAMIFNFGDGNMSTATKTESHPVLSILAF